MVRALRRLNVRAHRGPGDRAGRVNPTGSKAKYGSRVGPARYRLPGRPLDPPGNRRAREMTVADRLAGRHRTRLTGRPAAILNSLTSPTTATNGTPRPAKAPVRGAPGLSE